MVNWSGTKFVANPPLPCHSLHKHYHQMKLDPQGYF